MQLTIVISFLLQNENSAFYNQTVVALLFGVIISGILADVYTEERGLT